MRRLLGALAATVALVSGWSATGAGCASALTGTTPGHDQCDAAGRCLTGYVCETATHTCVLAGTTTGSTGGATTSTGGAGGRGTGGVGTGGVGTGGIGTGGRGTGGVDPGDAGDAGDAGCTSPRTVCGNACVDLRDDVGHCGACNTPCPSPLSGSITGSPLCAGSGCDVLCADATPLDCAEGDGNHACVDPETDPQNCGGCGQSCPGGQTCDGATCVPACGLGLTTCSGKCVRLTSDPANCGGCGKPCSGLAPYCNAGTCVSGLTGCGALTSCTVGSATACTDTAVDATHCGTCGTACGPSQTCAGGACVDYVIASKCWECTGTSRPTCCAVTGAPEVCVSGSACPSP